MARHRSGLTGILVVLLASCSSGGTELETMASAAAELVVEGNNRFALELYQKLRGGDKNLFFSPYSISTALAMTYVGAKGTTEVQMADTLRFPTSAKVLATATCHIGLAGHTTNPSKTSLPT